MKTTIKKNALKLITILFLVISISTNAQYKKRQAIELNGKEYIAPSIIGLPLHDKYTKNVWNYLVETKRIINAANRFKIEQPRNENGEIESVSELIINSDSGEKTTYKKALEELKTLKDRVIKLQQWDKVLNNQLNALTSEKVPLKKRIKEVKTLKNSSTIRVKSKVELGKILIDISKNTATIVKAQKLI